MSTVRREAGGLPPEQQAIQDKCFHPTGTFIEFKKEEIEQSIPDRFEEQVRSHPNQIAVKTRNGELTYHELNQAANRVARAILERTGAGEEPIPLLFEQGIQSIAAIMGVLKAGKFFVPLDPAFPHGRTSFMVDEMEPRLLLTNGRNLSLANEVSKNSCQLINVDELDSDLLAEDTDLSISPDALAFVVYTSGSTGEPKGVIQTHSCVLCRVMDNTNLFHICSYDRLILLHTYAVNGGLRAIFSALLAGATLYPFDVKSQGSERLSEWLVENEITIYHSAPTTFRVFVATLSGDEEFSNIRVLSFSGEPVLKSDVALYQAHFPQGCILANRLGSSECQTFRLYLLDHDTQVAASTLPAGYEVEGKEVLLLDEDHHEVGEYQVGEIAVKNRYLSPGYWKRPDLTRKTFLNDPDGAERIYLTGDIGRMQPDGCLEYLGRKDFQVQIGGHRVETAEIETALLSLDVIEEATVVSQQDDLGIQRLVACIVPAGRPAPTVSDLRRRLLVILPDFMVPSAFVFLKALPMLPSGKVDRLALPQPGPERPNLASLFVAPRTPVEEAMAQIWSEVLRLDAVGIHDEFMELGGDSLLAGQAISRVITTFNVEIPLRSLFEARTVAEMALVISQSQAQKVEQEQAERMLAELEALSDEQAKQAFVDDGP